jgi:hypothetical protein
MSALAQGRAAVYRARPRALEAVTLAYFVDRKPHWKPGQPRAVDVGSPAFETQLGPTWYGIDNGMRWMPKHAAVRLGAPLGRAAALRVAGRCPAAQVRSGPLKVWFSLRGRRFAEASLPKGDAGFSVTLPLPAESALQDVIEIGIEVERTFRAPGDLRDLGLAFGTFEIREESGM